MDGLSDEIQYYLARPEDELFVILGAHSFSGSDAAEAAFLEFVDPTATAHAREQGILTKAPTREEVVARGRAWLDKWTREFPRDAKEALCSWYEQQTEKGAIDVAPLPLEFLRHEFGEAVTPLVIPVATAALLRFGLDQLCAQ